MCNDTAHLAKLESGDMILEAKYHQKCLVNLYYRIRALDRATQDKDSEDICRKRSLMNALFNLGMCISYQCLLQLTLEFGSGVCERFELDGVVCPPKMYIYSGLFTVAAVDNLEYNISTSVGLA